MYGIQAIRDKTGEMFQAYFKISFQPVSDGKGQKKYQRHNAQKDRKTKTAACKVMVNVVRRGFFSGFVHKNFTDDFFNKIIFLVNHIFFVAAVYDTVCVKGKGFSDMRVIFQ